MNKQFAVRLSRAIETTNLNATQFASKAGIPQGTISKCLNGHVPTARILLRIAKLAGKSVDWLLTGKDQTGMREFGVAERGAYYGRSAGVRKPMGEQGMWVAKLLKVLRGRDERKKRTIKALLDMLSG